MAGRHARGRNGLYEQPSRSKRMPILLTSILGTVVVLSGTAYYMIRTPMDAFKGVSAVPTPAEKPPTTADRINFLLIGTDTRPGDTGGNTDVLILLSVDNLHKRIEMMSIPRDTKVLYPGGSDGKINHSLALGGPNLTINLVKSLLQQPVDYYALNHFVGLVDVINTLGGITINVKERMYYNTGDKQWNIIDLQPGVQNLNGVQALGFVRFRHDALGDIGRTERQQEFMTALSQKLLQPENVVKLPTLVRQFWSSIDTNLSLLELGDYAANASHYETYQVIHETLPGSFHNPDPQIPNDQSYWIVNPAQVKYVAKQFFDQGVVQTNPVQDPLTTINWQPPAANSLQNTTMGTTPGGNNGNASSITNSASPTASGTGTAVTVTATAMTVTAPSAYIRSGPGTNYSVVSGVMNGQTVQVIGTDGDWDKLQLSDGSVGYIANWLLASR